MLYFEEISASEGEEEEEENDDPAAAALRAKFYHACARGDLVHAQQLVDEGAIAAVWLGNNCVSPSFLQRALTQRARTMMKDQKEMKSGQLTHFSSRLNAAT